MYCNAIQKIFFIFYDKTSKFKKRTRKSTCVSVYLNYIQGGPLHCFVLYVQNGPTFVYYYFIIDFKNVFYVQ